MQHSQRGRDNPALNTAIEAANLLRKPVVVYFQILPRSPGGNLRHYEFMRRGLEELSAVLAQRNVSFFLGRYPENSLLRFCAENDPALIIGDENPLRDAEANRQRVANRLHVPFWTVDSDVIVPTRLLGKEHFAARTIRPKIHTLLPKFLQSLTNPTAQVDWPKGAVPRGLTANARLLESVRIDRSAPPVPTLAGGATAAGKNLQRFLRTRICGYATKRNAPELMHTSQLSPYLHFGHIGPHTIANAVRATQAPAADRNAFLEELIVRRELAINFVRYNPKYDSLDAAEPWADRSLRKHAADERKFVYSERALENAETHDPLWNAAQKQMVLTGWMHGYLRMYWAKKILEWSPSAAEAFDIAVRLNDRYELDGRDPNGYAGIAWAVLGKHDRAWGPERPVYGKLRYMSYESTSRKFDSKAYIAGIDQLEKHGEHAEDRL
jgi:deoxyribodipyrimidine photo-lyase